jgi:hypothetical protein
VHLREFDAHRGESIAQNSVTLVKRCD